MLPPPPLLAAPRQYSKLVEKLRALCKSATITIPPSLYKNKDNSSLEEALEALLQKHGLNADSGGRPLVVVVRVVPRQPGAGAPPWDV